MRSFKKFCFINADINYYKEHVRLSRQIPGHNPIFIGAIRVVKALAK